MLKVTEKLNRNIKIKREKDKVKQETPSLVDSKVPYLSDTVNV